MLTWPRAFEDLVGADRAEMMNLPRSASVLRPVARVARVARVRVAHEPVMRDRETNFMVLSKHHCQRQHAVPDGK